MHDPLVVAHTIRRPWPRISRRRTNQDGRLRIRYSWRKWYDIRPSNFCVFWFIGPLELYWPSFITVWHVEPGGRDSFEVCKHHSSWKWHIHHWRIQIHLLQSIRRRVLTRCSWCHGQSTKRDPVNVGHQWDGPRGRWWRGEPGLFHQDCSSIASAHKTCTCTDSAGGPWEHEVGGIPYGRCLACSLFRPWQSDDRRNSPALATNRILKTIPTGQRDKAKTARVRALWTSHRAAERATS